MTEALSAEGKTARPGEAASEVTRLSLALRLLPQPEQASALADYFERFRAAVGWLLPRIRKCEERDNECARFIGNRKKREKKRCPICERQEKKDRRAKTGQAAIELKWKLKADNKLVCSSRCVLADAASRLNHQRHGNGFGLCVAELLMAFDVASASVKGQQGALRRAERRVSETQDRIDEWNEVLRNDKIERDGHVVAARSPVEGEPGKYVHYDRREEAGTGRTLNSIQSHLDTVLKPQLIRLTELLRAKEKAATGVPNKVKLRRASLLDFQLSGTDSWIELQLGSDTLKLAFSAPSERRENKGFTATQLKTHERYIRHLEDGFAWLEALKGSGNLPETTIHRRGSRFICSIPVWHEKPRLTGQQRAQAMPLGLDVGERRHVMAALNVEGKPCHIKFFRSSELKHLRQQHRLRLEKLSRRKLAEPIPSKALRKRRRKSGRRITHAEHSLTRQVAEYIRAIWEAERKPLIVGVEDVRGLWDMMKQEKLKVGWLKPQTGRKGEGAKAGEGAAAVCQKLHSLLAKDRPSGSAPPKRNPRLDRLARAKAPAQSALEPAKLSQAIADALSAHKKPAPEGLDWLCTEGGAKAVYEKLKGQKSFTAQQLGTALKQTIEHERVRRRKEANRHAIEAKAFRSFFQRLEYKLYLLRDERGQRIPLEFVSVDPSHTSSHCYRCGAVNRDYEKQKKRKSGTVFTCAKCNKTINADLNGAINIAKTALKAPGSEA